ncbi:MAG: Bug family tripartite tricarboxylate transporter substrate binding protein [Burkholderiales bacterium]
MTRNRFTAPVRWCAILVAMLAAAPAAAQSYPSKPVKLVVGFPPGGPTDIISRLVAGELGKNLGEQVLIDNRPGAGGNIAAEHVARSAPDGYTLLMTHPATHAIAPALYANLKFDVVRDFAPVLQLVTVPNMMVVNPSLPVSNVRELIELARKRPGEINFASGGSGTTAHLSGELFKTLTGVNMVHVSYRGGAPAVADLIAGQVQVMIDNMQSLLQHVRAGRLKAIAVTPKTRVAAVPELPTIAESGVPDFEVTSWFGIVAPAGTPQPVIDRLHAEATKAIQNPAVAGKLQDLGATTVSSNPAAFSAFIKAEIAKWAPVVKSSGARVE